MADLIIEVVIIFQLFFGPVDYPRHAAISHFAPNPPPPFHDYSAGFLFPNLKHLGYFNSPLPDSLYPCLERPLHSSPSVVDLPVPVIRTNFNQSQSTRHRLR